MADGCILLSCYSLRHTGMMCTIHTDHAHSWYDGCISASSCIHVKFIQCLHGCCESQQPALYKMPLFWQFIMRHTVFASCTQVFQLKLASYNYSYCTYDSAWYAHARAWIDDSALRYFNFIAAHHALEVLTALHACHMYIGTILAFCQATSSANISSNTSQAVNCVFLTFSLEKMLSSTSWRSGSKAMTYTIPHHQCIVVSCSIVVSSINHNNYVQGCMTLYMSSWHVQYL